MELRQFFRIFVIHRMIFWGVICASVVIGIIFFFGQPQVYKTEILLNVTRDRVQNTSEYMYDDFYRLQADERFADTIVQWIMSPYIKMRIGGLSGNVDISARRVSSQVVEVHYKTRTIFAAKEYAEKLISVINDESQKLNRTQAKTGWFVVIGTEPIITDATYSFHFLFVLFGIVGFFVAFWTVIILHYVIGGEIKK
ncbi:MAG: hypothetical protein CR972_01205 [Candidatus Moraniibacteriota bacterium]|nr:MAG: hypothetical protein CR972_01205 [Candidatus Moranbacteria bacterium]